MLFGLFNFVYLNYLVFFLIFFFLSTNTLRFSSLNLFFKNPLNMVFNQAKLLNFNWLFFWWKPLFKKVSYYGLYKTNDKPTVNSRKIFF